MDVKCDALAEQVSTTLLYKCLNVLHGMVWHGMAVRDLRLIKGPLLVCYFAEMCCCAVR